MKPTKLGAKARASDKNWGRGFTLVEILIVLAIVGLLAALLFPVFERVRAKGRRTTCASNLKQLSQAFELYAGDYRSYPHIGSGRGCLSWPHKIYPYVKSTAIFECPSFPQGSFNISCPAPDFTDPARPILFQGSYDVNLPFGGYYQNPNTAQITISVPVPERFRPVLYTRPSSTILILDGEGRIVAPGYENPVPTTTTDLVNHGVNARHEGGANVAFADGHVKWMSLESLLKLSLWKMNGAE